MPVFALPFQGRRCVSVCFGQAPTAQLRRTLAHALDPKAHRVPLTPGHQHHERFSRLVFPTRDQHHTGTCSRLCCPRRPSRDKPHRGSSLVHGALPGRPCGDMRAPSRGPSKCDTMHPARSRYRKSPIRAQQHTGNDSALSVSCSRSTNTSRLSLLPRLACPSSHPDRPFASNVAPSRRARTKSLFRRFSAVFSKTCPALHTNWSRVPRPAYCSERQRPPAWRAS
jgi:hypothetical protein